MATSNDIFSKEWSELVLGSREHAYGAYELRIHSPQRHFWALILAILIFLFTAFFPVLMRQIVPGKIEREVTVRQLANIQLEKPKEVNFVAELPPPPAVRNTVKFTPPVIKPDNLVQDEEQPISQKEAVETKAAIGTVNFDKGTDDVTAPIATVDRQTAITEDTDKPFVIVEQMPQFPGGDVEMMRFIKQNLRYPATAIEMGIQGTVTVTFVVGRDGRITHIKVIRGIGAGCDEEAVRILEKMPAWNPGRQSGIAVPVTYSVPFKFILQ